MTCYTLLNISFEFHDNWKSKSEKALPLPLELFTFRNVIKQSLTRLCITLALYFVVKTLAVADSCCMANIVVCQSADIFATTQHYWLTLCRITLS